MNWGIFWTIATQTTGIASDTPSGLPLSTVFGPRNGREPRSVDQDVLTRGDFWQFALFGQR